MNYCRTTGCRLARCDYRVLTPIAQWHKSIGDATLADAILDRLLHNSHKLKLKGESMRKSMSEIAESDHME